MKKFTEDDVERFKKWVNTVGTKMSFDAGLKLSDIPSLYADLAWIQSSLIPTIEANILEIMPAESETKEDREARANDQD